MPGTAIKRRSQMRRTGKLLPLLAAVIILAAPAALAGDAFEDVQKRVHQKTLSNGLKVILFENHDAPVISFVTQANVVELFFCSLGRLFFAQFEHYSRGKGGILQNGQVRKGIPLLEHHAKLLPQLVLVGAFCMDINFVDDDSSLLDIFNGVDAV